MKKVSVVILNWNGAALLRTYLPSVCKNTDLELADIMVADNGSDDDSLEILRKEFPEVKIIALPMNLGFAGGYNEALKQVDSEYIVLLNSDVEVTPRWLEPLVAYADTHPQVAAIQPKIRSLRNRSRFEHAGACGGFIDRYGFPFCRGRIFDSVEEDNGQYDEAMEIFWATGACFFTRKADYEQAGGLDPLFFAHMEEIDLCWRYHLAGRKLVCLPQSTVYHLGGATLDMSNPHKTYLNFRNNLLILYKNLPVSERSSLIFKRKLIDAFAALGFALQGNFKNIRAIMLAHRDADRMIRSYYQPKHEPKQEPKRFPILGQFPYSRNSIVAAYYLLRKKRFSALRK